VSDRWLLVGWRRSRGLLTPLCLLLLLYGCGKKGSPLPPVQRIPVAPADFSVTRIDDRVYARFTVPVTNIDGERPADVAGVELYAITADRLPQADVAVLRKLATRVGAEPVRRVLPPPPPPRDGYPALPLPPPLPGVDQGDQVVLRETLTADTMTPVDLPAEPDAPNPRLSWDDVPRALVAPDAGAEPQRFYFAVAVSPRGRYGPPTALVPAPLGPVSGAPARPEITYDETSLTIRWAPPADARGLVEAADPDLLPSRSLAPAPEPTSYDIYEVPGPAAQPSDATAMPTPLTPAPVFALEFTAEGVTLGTERCFVVRPVDIVSGVHVRGPASPMACTSLADIFPPSPPARLEALATSDTISLIWEPSDAPDLAGYIVLRGEAPGAALTPLTVDPAAASTYRDASVQPGVRYVYAVVAVDRAGNRSEPSNLVEETARQ
jgi:hypothetical protein